MQNREGGRGIQIRVGVGVEHERVAWNARRPGPGAHQVGRRLLRDDDIDVLECEPGSLQAIVDGAGQALQGSLREAVAGRVVGRLAARSRGEHLAGLRPPPRTTAVAARG